MNQSYEQKYLKYKQKYIQLKAELEGGLLGIKNPFAAKPYDKNDPDVVAAQKEVAKYKEIIAVLGPRDDAETEFQNKSKALATSESNVKTASTAVETSKAKLEAAQNTVAEVLQKHGLTPENQTGGWNWNPFAKVGAEKKKYQGLLAEAEKTLANKIAIAVEKAKLAKLQGNSAAVAPAAYQNNYW